jgi:hypothetical protein
LGIILFAAITAGIVAFMTIDAWDEDMTFEQFVNKYEKEYESDEEYSRREQIYYENKDSIKRHNSDETEMYTLKINKFADLTQDEFAEMYLSPNHFQYTEFIEDNSTNYYRPDSIDWTTKGKVPAVQNLGASGYCTSVVAAEAIESMWATSGHDLLKVGTGMFTCANQTELDSLKGAFDFVVKKGGLKPSCYGATKIPVSKYTKV